MRASLTERKNKFLILQDSELKSAKRLHLFFQASDKKYRDVFEIKTWWFKISVLKYFFHYFF